MQWAEATIVKHYGFLCSLSKLSNCKLIHRVFVIYLPERQFAVLLYPHRLSETRSLLPSIPSFPILFVSNKYNENGLSCTEINFSSVRIDILTWAAFLFVRFSLYFQHLDAFADSIVWPYCCCFYLFSPNFEMKQWQQQQQQQH